MATISQIRSGIATRLATITGLNTHDIVPSTVNPPAAVVFGPEIDFDSTMARGSDDFRFHIILLVASASDRDAQELLDSYLAPGGATSVKAAVEGAGGDLGGVVDFVRVKEVREYGPQEVNGMSYFGAAVLVEVTARP